MTADHAALTDKAMPLTSTGTRGRGRASTGRTARIGFGVIAGGALEPGQVRGHCQPQLISERHRTIGGHWGQFGELHHDPTLRSFPAAAKAAGLAPDTADPVVHGSIAGRLSG